MDHKVVFALGCVVLAACSPVQDKYRDIKHLELPPVLAVEHSTSAPAERTGRSDENSDLERLILIVGSETQPRLQLKAGFDRTWDLVDKAIRQAEIEVIDKNRDNGSIRVRYVSGDKEKQGTSLFTLFGGDAGNEYIVKVDKDKRTTEVNVTQVRSPAQAEDKSDQNKSDDAAKLVRLLHKTIITSLEK
jgi:uncharacterized lipoprotein